MIPFICLIYSDLFFNVSHMVRHSKWAVEASPICWKTLGSKKGMAQG
jgi:hypothetical protein